LLISVSVSHLTAQRSSTLTISVVATSDVHGGVVPRGDRGGLALLGGYVRNIRAARMQDGGGVLLVDSGDMFQGTLESNLNEGVAVVRAYNTLGYAAAALGNH
jgi:5'-nucleotidase